MASDREEERKKMEDGEEEKQNRDRYAYLKKTRRTSSLRKKESTAVEFGASAGRARVWRAFDFFAGGGGGLLEHEKVLRYF